MSAEDSLPVVLLVDDEEEFLDSASRALGRRGFEVLTACCGEEAFRQLRSRVVDLVLLDVKMPGMDGEEVFHLLRKDFPDVAVVMLTGHGTIPQAFQMSKDGVADYLAKPCDMDDLAEKIRTILAQRRQQKVPMAPGTISVLLVDDELELLEALTRPLERRGMKVLTVRSGTAAVEILGSVDIDVVVLDVKMPGMDGLEVLRLVKRDFPDRAVVLLTGHPSIETAVAGLHLGAMEYLLKPPDVEQLTSLIQRGARERRDALDDGRSALLREALDRRPE